MSAMNKYRQNREMSAMCAPIDLAGGASRTWRQNGLSAFDQKKKSRGRTAAVGKFENRACLVFRGKRQVGWPLGSRIGNSAIKVG